MPFAAGGDACEVCQSLDGTLASAPAHENCSCQSTEEPEACEYDISMAAPNTRTGSGNYDVTMHLEIEVFCRGRSIGGVMLELDLSDYPGDDESGGDVLDYIDDIAMAEAEDICNCGPYLVV